MARQMVINYGFSDIGPWSLLDQNAQSQDMIMRMMARNSTSESLQRRIDEAVKKIADEAYTLALKHVRYVLASIISYALLQALSNVCGIPVGHPHVLCCISSVLVCGRPCSCLCPDGAPLTLVL